MTRDIYTIRGLVRSGNSGGPLIDSDGDVLGVVFAAAADDPQTGFALTAAEAAPVINDGPDRDRAASHRFLHRLTAGRTAQRGSARA